MGYEEVMFEMKLLTPYLPYQFLVGLLLRGCLGVEFAA